ncbi:MAG: hypothetical protein CMB80_20600 [Flammeovirgaceae bacterium]|nr:hypothetical protein [Flammeovirgaceae bacterium]HCX20315.1 hypothetical protein [Cytophagales bacterium]
MDNMVKKIDWLNIGLLAMSLTLAYILPFRLFIFSYAILGPLHYLTEIHWLKSKNYFIHKQLNFQEQFLYLGIIISTISFAHIYAISYFKSSILNVFSFQVLILFAFILSLSMLWIKKPSGVIIAGIMSYILAVCIRLLLPKWILIAGMLLPTIVHVFVFTALFMLFGANKSKSSPGYIAFALLILIPIIIAWAPINITDNSTPDIQDSLTRTGMSQLNHTLSKIISLLDWRDLSLPINAYLKIQVFIAFAYTYHYLNWFSKTSVIGWRKSMSSNGYKWVLVVWLASITLYFYDFTTGFYALFFLSSLHVILELPLNMVTIKNLLPSFTQKNPHS